MSNTVSILGGPPPVEAAHNASSAKAGASGPLEPVAAVKPAPLYVNPDYRYDASVGMVVMEFHNTAGTLTNSIPSQRQLDAYRTHQLPLPGENPPSVKPNGEASSG
jgi:hypothetical protein